MIIPQKKLKKFMVIITILIRNSDESAKVNIDESMDSVERSDMSINELNSATPSEENNELI